MSNSSANHFNPELCTPETCSVKLDGIIHYQPSLPANYAFIVIFALFLLVQLGLGVRYRTWGFAAAICSGLVLEIVGYFGRVQLHSNPFSLNIYVIYLVGLTIGPTCISASIYLCLARIIRVYGVHLSRWNPRTYTLTFMTFDFISLVLQAAGGAIASMAGDESVGDIGVHTMVAGLTFQVISLVVFIGLCSEYAMRIRRAGSEKDTEFVLLRESFKFKAFLYALAVATFAIFIRSVYRIAELQGGFNSVIANNETAFIILEGPMIVFATLALTLCHPGYSFDGNWHSAGWSLRNR